MKLFAQSSGLHSASNLLGHVQPQALQIPSSSSGDEGLQHVLNLHLHVGLASVHPLVHKVVGTGCPVLKTSFSQEFGKHPFPQGWENHIFPGVGKTLFSQRVGMGNTTRNRGFPTGNWFPRGWENNGFPGDGKTIDSQGMGKQLIPGKWGNLTPKTTHKITPNTTFIQNYSQ